MPVREFAGWGGIWIVKSFRIRRYKIMQIRSDPQTRFFLSSKPSPRPHSSRCWRRCWPGWRNRRPYCGAPRPAAAPCTWDSLPAPPAQTILVLQKAARWRYIWSFLPEPPGKTILILQTGTSWRWFLRFLLGQPRPTCSSSDRSKIALHSALSSSTTSKQF